MERLSPYTDEHVREWNANDFVKLISCLVFNPDAGQGPYTLSDQMNRVHAAEEFARRWPRSVNINIIEKAMTYQVKAVTNFGTTTEPSWAAPLAVVQPLQTGFLALARPFSLLGKIQNRYRSVPLNVSVPAQTGGGTYGWTGQGAAKAVGNLQLQSITLPPTKAAGLVIVTAELLRLTSEASVVTLRNELARGLAVYLDQQLVTATVAAVTNVSPGSITNLAPSFGSSGTSAANCQSDLKKLFATFFAANADASSAIVFMSPANAAAAAAALAADTFGADGGRLWGVQLETSQACGQHVVMFDPQALAVADGDAIDVSISREAAPELDTASASPPSAANVIVGLWQLGLIGVRCERVINWRLGRNSAAVYTVATWL
jgi:HK97 family phage major capsid protein